jgi:hypothetical protein
MPDVSSNSSNSYLSSLKSCRVRLIFVQRTHLNSFLARSKLKVIMQAHSEEDGLVDGRVMGGLQESHKVQAATDASGIGSG